MTFAMMLDDIIHKFGFEDRRTIEFAFMEADGYDEEECTEQYNYLMSL